jgi:hypothetical protein
MISLIEIVEARNLPAPPGTIPIPSGHIRLYHQTTEENLQSIEQNGLLYVHAKGIEGPKSIYATKTPFYGEATQKPTLEFHIPDNKLWWNPPCFVLKDVPVDNIIAAHYPWHIHARYILSNPEVLQATLRGENDNIGGDYDIAVAYVKLVMKK